MFLTTKRESLGRVCHSCGDEEDCVAIRMGNTNPAEIHLCETCLDELRDALMGLHAAEQACEGTWEYQSRG